jgi:hypothetical protein
MALIVLSQIIEAGDVSGTVVTEVLQDSSGDYVREYRFYGQGETVGGEGPLLLTVRVKAGDKPSLQFSTGSLTI